MTQHHQQQQSQQNPSSNSNSHPPRSSSSGSVITGGVVDAEYTGPPARKKFAVDHTNTPLPPQQPQSLSLSSSAIYLQQQQLLQQQQMQAANLLSTPLSTNSSGPMVAGPVPFTGTSAAEIADAAKKLAKEINEFMLSHPQSSSAPAERRGGTENDEDDDDDDDSDYFYCSLLNEQSEDIVDLQLATCRKLRELLPQNRDLLFLAQERNWIPLMLNWLNLHDRPAVQVEALLALTSIAELCAQQSYFQHTAQQTSAVAAAAQAAVSAVKGTAASLQDAMEAANKLTASASKYPYPGLAPAPGSVPFPPLSFSQTLSPEAVAAFDASLVSTLQSSMDVKPFANMPVVDTASFAATTKDSSINHGKNGKSWSNPLSPHFPSSTSSAAALACAVSEAGINFSSLAPPPSGAHNSIPSNAYMPPPTPVAHPAGGPSFPQSLSASSQHLLLRHADAIPTLISLLSSPNREVYEQSMWILGSIAAGDTPTGASNSTPGNSSTNSLEGRDKSVSARDVILAAGVMNPMLKCLDAHPNNLSLQRIGSWTLSNLVDGIFQQSSHSKTGSKPSDYSSADEIDMTILLPVLRRLLRMTDSEVLSYTCWTLSHLCDGPSSHIAAVVTSRAPKAPKGGLVPRLVELLMHPSWRVTKPALRCIGNIVCAECSEETHGSSTTTTDYTEVILECDAVPRLKDLINHSNREIQKEACWTLSNIAAGTVDQIQAVIDSGAIPYLVKLVRDKKTDQEVRSEACWVVLNATSCGSDPQIEVLVDEGCVSVLGVLLTEASMVMMALEGLERVLQVEESRELIRRDQIDNGELEDDDENRPPSLVSAALIEKARDSHTSSAVVKRAERIWKQHFVSCALCKKSFSKHRIAEASFCEECKCHVCCNCNCRIYHLDYQEELWAATEEKTEAKKNAKKSKNKKKKEKLKQKKAKQVQDIEPEVQVSRSVALVNEEPDELPKDTRAGISKSTGASEKLEIKDADEEKEVELEPTSKLSLDKKDDVEDKAHSPTPSFDEEEDEDDAQNQIDFVLYLQQTGSIIALAKLMDALEYGGDDYDELDDYERKMIREQQLMRGQATM